MCFVFVLFFLFDVPSNKNPKMVGLGIHGLDIFVGGVLVFFVPWLVFEGWFGCFVWFLDWLVDFKEHKNTWLWVETQGTFDEKDPTVAFVDFKGNVH